MLGRRRNPGVERKNIYNVLFLCTGNSARSILAEAILNRLGEGRFRAYSAGSHPKGEVHPLTVDLLRDLGYTTREVRSKSWDEFSKPGAPEMDLVITVCDNAAGEACPFWAGRPVKAHWGVPDPVATEGDEETRREAFQAAYRRLEVRLRRFAELDLATKSTTNLQMELERIGKIPG